MANPYSHATGNHLLMPISSVRRAPIFNLRFTSFQLVGIRYVRCILCFAITVLTIFDFCETKRLHDVLC